MGRMGLISATSRIVSLARLGALSAARKVFDEMPERDEVAWNAMLAACSRAGEPRRALSLFSSMRVSGARPDAFSSTALISGATDVSDLRTGMTLHALVVRSGLRSSVPVSNSLIDMYGKCSCASDALRVFDEMEEPNEVSWCSLLYSFMNEDRFEEVHAVFDEMPVKNAVAWNILIMGYARNGEVAVSMALFKRMRSSGLEGDYTTFGTLLNVCSELQDPFFGRMIHGVVVKSGSDALIEVNNSTLSFYARSGDVGDASKVFESMNTWNTISWNAMIDARMSAGDVDDSISLFQSAPETNIVTWTTMIGGFARNGHGDKAIAFFLDMSRTHLRPDDLAFGAVLHACAVLTVLEIGRMTHALILLSGFTSYVYVANGLLNMYAKCGDIKSSEQVFDEISNRDLVSWNAMLFAYSLHACAPSALKVFDEMLLRGVIADKFTFLGLLMACSHAGLVEKGRTVFETMETVHGVVPDEDHKACFIDMLGRAGREEEARELLNKCSEWSKVARGSCVISGEELVAMAPEKEDGYVMLSNLYCGSGRWREAEEVRRLMAERGVKKAPGCSWIEVRGRVVVFVSGVQAIRRTVGAREMIEWLAAEMRCPSSPFDGVS
ncbi:hypothetical protein J5N97_029221 [Dioscorea zingiberensis]|uniref:Chlororespiratory reduction 4 n=1 Tax=Dioscorea zingiberensis TaxID=325984 RepID=A0A9D5H5F3_9LILI|nr:hypothetical protein J5N97_029221 [Dioscorea zingiberensis]